MDDEMVDRGSKVEEETNPCKEDSGLMHEEKHMGRKVVSYMDKVLCLNGDSYASEGEEDDWAMAQRREEEEDGMSDEVDGGEEDDPLCPTYVFSRKQYHEDCRKWRKSLIIKLMGNKIAPRFLMARLQRLWNLIGSYELTDLDNGHLLLMFSDDKDYHRVLHEGPWIVSDHYVIV